jgi:hypothetical protein
MWDIPPHVVVYMSRVCVNAAPYGPHLVHALEEFDIVCLSREVAKGTLHRTELEQLHMAHRRQRPAGQTGRAAVQGVHQQQRVTAGASLLDTCASLNQHALQF